MKAGDLLYRFEARRGSGIALTNVYDVLELSPSGALKLWDLPVFFFRTDPDFRHVCVYTHEDNVGKVKGGETFTGGKQAVLWVTLEENDLELATKMIIDELAKLRNGYLSIVVGAQEWITELKGQEL